MMIGQAPDCHSDDLRFRCAVDGGINFWSASYSEWMFCQVKKTYLKDMHLKFGCFFWSEE